MKPDRITMEEMRELYPNEYLFLTECTHDGVEITEGIVVAHSPNIDEIDKVSGAFKGNGAVWYTGEYLPEGTYFL